jgi:putative PIN family toxin of toxin-antitoxin system
VRAVVDTNIWVSAFIAPHGHPAKVLAALMGGRFEAIFPRAILDELFNVLNRPRIAKKYRLHPGAIAVYVVALEATGEVVMITGDVCVSRDAKDDMVIEAAIVGGADVIVSGDGDVRLDLDVIKYLAAKGVGVMSARQFLEVLDSLPAIDVE